MMAIRALRCGFAALAVVLGAGLALVRADVTVSSSSSPLDTVEPAVGRALELERRAFFAIDPDRAAALAGGRRPPARPVPLDEARLASMKPATGDREWQCLAQAIYFEARGETLQGQLAVAQVIMNRVRSSRFPNSVCEVVWQGTGKRFRCQFTFTCDGRAEVVTEPRAWERAGKIARLVLDGRVPDLTRGATFYHSKAVRPSWARRFRRTVVVGSHIFYSPHGGAG